MDSSLINKKILHAGTKNVTISNGYKVTFHYCTRKCDEDKTVIDDSKKVNSPMELIIGKKFKFDVWEAVVQTMALNEVASFTVDKSLLYIYPFVSKTIRDARNPKKEYRSQCCAAAIQNNGVGYDDLNELIKQPTDLEFILELINVESPEEYVRESWQLEDDEKLQKIPQLKEEGNELYCNKEYKKAIEKYAFALEMLEQLMLKEKPKEEEWNNLNNIKIPILLNYAQCKLLESDFYSVIEHCTTVLDSDPKNLKALYRRGKAHIGAWNFAEAESDFLKIGIIEPKLNYLVQMELRKLNSLKRSKIEEEKAKLKWNF